MRFARGHCPSTAFAGLATWLLALLLLGRVGHGAASALSVSQPRDAPSQIPLISRNITLSLLSDVETAGKPKCEDVHKAEDKCAFSARYCHEDDTGLLDYVDLYFCKMHNARPAYWTIMVVWLLTLFASIGVSASEFLTINLGALSYKLGMSHSLAGVTLLALGNGSPDLFSTFTAMSNHSGSLAIGELIGAAGFITTVVAAATGFVRPFRVKKYALIRDLSFFAVAVAFSLFFLIDGHLTLWECIVMVIFYVLYVVLVFSWHFLLGRITKKKKQQSRARGHFSSHERRVNPREPSPVAMGEFEGIDGEEPMVDETQPLLEAAQHDPDEDDDEDDEGPDTREQLLSEMATITDQMRVTHRHRRTFSRMTSTGQAIRPSLLGALEFGSVLQSLERARTARDASPAPVRRHSDQPSERTISKARTGRHVPAQLVDNTSSGAALLPTPDTHATSRLRSASLNAADLLNGDVTHDPANTGVGTSDRPAYLHPSQAQVHSTSTSKPTPHLSPLLIPHISISDPAGQISAMTPGAETTAFPEYSDDTTLMASPVAEASLGRASSWPLTKSKTRWSRTRTFFSHVWRIFFPQLADWRAKGYADRVMSVLMIPAIVVLTITVPIGEIIHGDAAKPAVNEPVQSSAVGAVIESAGKDGIGGHLGTGNASLQSSAAPSPLLSPISDQGDTFEEREAVCGGPDDICWWNPYVVSLQIMTAPTFMFFVVYKGWLGIEGSSDTELIIWCCSMLAVSLALLSAFWWTNVPGKVPRWQPWLSIPGFFVAIAWISMIADEVVAVLKTFQLITGFSEAILGLIVFAAGNSVSDLFANFNTARAGRPVMAFHACFGGPMLNILLGIGLGGMYHTIKKGSKHSENGRAPLGTQFHIDVGRTLIVSGVGLLLTLVGILVAVWWNRWKMDRKIGIVLVCFWCVVTVVNVVLEILQIQGVIKPW